MDEQSQTPAAPRNRHIYLLPNLLTTGGMFSGFYAILAAASGHYVAASIAIFVAGLFDGLDGRVARLTGTTSEFGIQYDSLADLVSFGMAPALLMYHWALSMMKFDGAFVGKIGWAAAFLYMACAALRLARFNVQTGSTDKRWFIGLASPAAAGLMASFVWAMTELGWSGEQMRFLALAVTVIAGLLMVSRIRYFSFKGFVARNKIPFWVLFLVVLTLVGLFVLQELGLLAVAVLYVLSGPLLWFKTRKVEAPVA
jgi:CDP-diacylglycerol---serine O-phosphatidyltransferase